MHQPYELKTIHVDITTKPRYKQSINVRATEQYSSTVRNTTNAGDDWYSHCWFCNGLTLCHYYTYQRHRCNQIWMINIKLTSLWSVSVCTIAYFSDWANWVDLCSHTLKCSFKSDSMPLQAPLMKGFLLQTLTIFSRLIGIPATVMSLEHGHSFCASIWMSPIECSGSNHHHAKSATGRCLSVISGTLVIRSIASWGIESHKRLCRQVNEVGRNCLAH